MSYRLIDANTIAESYTEVHDMPCIYADLPRGLDGGHYDMRGASTLQAENAKLREFATETWELLTCNEPVFVWKGLQELARNLGIEVDDG